MKSIKSRIVAWGLTSTFLIGFSSGNIASAMHDGPDNIKYYDKVVECTKPSYRYRGIYTGRYLTYGDGTELSVYFDNRYTLSLYRSKPGECFVDRIYFQSNEKLDALVEKLYTLRKRFEECSQDEEESVKKQINAVQIDIAEEIFDIYEVDSGIKHAREKASVVYCRFLLKFLFILFIAFVLSSIVGVLIKERLNTDVSINNGDDEYSHEEYYV